MFTFTVLARNQESFFLVLYIVEQKRVASY